MEESVHRLFHHMTPLEEPFPMQQLDHNNFSLPWIIPHRLQRLVALRLLTLVMGLLGGLIAVTSGCGGADIVRLDGTGATFPETLYQEWFLRFSEKNPKIKVEYTGQGSSVGINQFKEGLVDFGASDAAMEDQDIAEVDGGVQLIPLTAGAIVLCYNLQDTNGEEIKDLKLPRDVYPKIFLGEIKKWNHPDIAKANPTIQLPDTDIVVVFRDAGSGTTFVFTKHLAAISQAWKDGPGVAKEIQWPTGSGASGNNGIAEAVQRTDGAIGYVEFGYAQKAKGLQVAQLQNQSLEFVKPSTESARAALDSVSEIPENLRVWVEDPESPEAYPIVTYTWLLLRKKYDDPKKAKALKDLVNYCLTEGQSLSEELGYVPLPEGMVKRCQESLENIVVEQAPEK